MFKENIFKTGRRCPICGTENYFRVDCWINDPTEEINVCIHLLDVDILNGNLVPTFSEHPVPSETRLKQTGRVIFKSYHLPKSDLPKIGRLFDYLLYWGYFKVIPSDSFEEMGVALGECNIQANDGAYPYSYREYRGDHIIYVTNSRRLIVVFDAGNFYRVLCYFGEMGSENLVEIIDEHLGSK